MNCAHLLLETERLRDRLRHDPLLRTIIEVDLGNQNSGVCCFCGA